MLKYNYTLFQDPCLKYPVNPEINFESYIAECKTLIQNTRMDLHDNMLSEQIVTANSPFELKPKGKARYGALLIHGLFDCPFVMKDIGLHLQAEGLLTRAILLPGHGTVPGGLLHVSYNDWLETLAYGIASLTKEVDRIILVGFSTGASLALYHTLQNTNNNIAGLILLAPAIKIHSALDFASHWPILLSKTWERAAWLNMTDEIDYTKYQSMTFNSIYQVYQLTNAVKAALAVQSTSCPQLVIISQEDQTVSSHSTLQYFQQYASPESQLLLYTNHVNPHSDSRVTTRTATFPEWNIADISHVAIPIAPDNSHYGKKGDYVYASHVEENLQANEKYLYGTYGELQNKFLDMFHNVGLSKYQHLRLTFNPDFEFLKKTVSAFLSSEIVTSSR